MLEKNYSNLSKSLILRFCEEQVFSYLLPKGKFRYNLKYANKFVIARFFTQRLLEYNQYFASDTDYIKFCQVFQGHLRLSINFAIQKIKPVTLTAEIVKNNYKEANERFVTCANSF